MYIVAYILIGIVTIFYLFAMTLGFLAVIGGGIDIVKGKRHAQN